MEVEIKREFYPNGAIRSETPYVNGKIEGIEKWYYGGGNIYIERHFEKNKLTFLKRYHPSGLADGEREYLPKGGYIDRDYVNGILRRETSYKHRAKNGLEKIYNNGVLVQIKNYKNNFYEGEYKEFYPSGKLRVECNYKEHREEGIKKRYFENGVIQSETPYVNGKIEGIEKWYYESGKIKRTITYKGGERVGEDTLYNEKGGVEKITLFGKEEKKLGA